MIERNVRTSPIFGTLWRVKLSKKSHAAISGRAAFLEPEILTVPERDWGQVILSIVVYIFVILRLAPALA